MAFDRLASAMLPHGIGDEKLLFCPAFRQGIRVASLLSSFPHPCQGLLTPPARRVVRLSRIVGIFFLVGLLVSVICLAHASPPDPIWIPGIYDHGDFDDAVLAVLCIDALTVSRFTSSGSEGGWQMLPAFASSVDSSQSVDRPPSRSPPLA